MKLLKQFLHSSWSNEPFRRLVKNSMILISGDSLAVGLNFCTFALSARALGASTFGVLAVITAYVTIMDGLLNFQSWQAIIRYGATCLEENNQRDFKRLVKFGFSLDIVTALLGAAVAAACAGAVGRWSHWPSETVTMATVYSVVIVFHIIGAPTGILRLFDHFKLFSLQKGLGAGARLIGVVIAFILKADVWAYLLIWALSDILSYIFLVTVALVELRKQGFSGIWKERIRHIGQYFPGIWSFVWTTNLDGMVRVARQMDIIIVGKLLSFEAVGIYKVGRQFAALFSKVIEPFYSAIYPDLARLVSRGERVQFRNLIFRSSGMLGVLLMAAWLVFLGIGPFIINGVFGIEYSQSYNVAVWCTLAVVIWGFSQPFAPGVLAMGYAGASYTVHLVSTASYLLLLVYFTIHAGIVGAALSYAVFNTIWLISISSTMLFLYKSKWTAGSLPYGIALQNRPIEVRGD